MQNEQRSKVTALIAGAIAVGTLVFAAGQASAAPPVVAGQNLSAIASDNFSVASTSGLPAVAVGGAWSTQLASGSAYSVSGNQAVLSGLQPGKSSEAWLPAVQTGDADVSAAFAIPVMGPTTKLYHGLEARRQADGSRYMAKTIVTGSGSVTVSFSRFVGSTETSLGSSVLTSTVAKAGQPLQVDFNVSGSGASVTLQTRVYTVGSVVPAWQATFADTSSARIVNSGAIGIWDYVSGTSPALTVDQSNLAAYSVTPARNVSATGARGSLAIGSARYTIPANAVYVDSTNGADTGTGKIASPFKTVMHAVNVSGNGATIVLRAGTYHEGSTGSNGSGIGITESGDTIMNFPGQVVWMDGSVPVTGWTQSGSVWTAPVVAQFDHSSSYTLGDTTAPGPSGWDFINPAHPMAAWPDQVYQDGVQLTQVSSAPGAGQFSVDYTAGKISVGTNPTGHSMASTSLDRAFTVTGANVTIEGIGMRRFATSLPNMGSVVFKGANDVLQNSEVDDSATQAVSFGGANDVLNHVTIQRAGLEGVGAHLANNLVIENSNITGSNEESFNSAPTAAGIKVDNLTDVTIQNNNVSNTNGASGIWTDENVTNFAIVGNTTSNNGQGYAGAGITTELSDNGIVADNTSLSNGYGIFTFDTGDEQIVNNEFGQNGIGSVFMSQDDRRINPTAGPSVRPSASNPWTLHNIQIENNVFGVNVVPYGFQVYVLDKKTNEPASAMGITIDGNQFHTPSVSSPTVSSDAMVGWGGSDNSTVTHYNTPAALDAGVGKTWNNVQALGSPAAADLDSAAELDTNAVALPSTVATAIGQPAGTRHVGIF